MISLVFKLYQRYSKYILLNQVNNINISYFNILIVYSIRLILKYILYICMIFKKKSHLFRCCDSFYPLSIFILINIIAPILPYINKNSSKISL